MRIIEEVALELPERATLHRGSSNSVRVNAINAAVAVQLFTAYSYNSADAHQAILIYNG